jgi:hypothetical protein
LKLTAKPNEDSFRRKSAFEAEVQFILGVFLFVVVVGAIDARAPWPKPRERGART